MLKMFAIVSALVLVASGASAQPYKLDASGKCRTAKGAFAAAENCKTVAPAKPVQCKDAKGRFAKCGTAGASPIKK